MADLNVNVLYTDAKYVLLVLFMKNWYNDQDLNKWSKTEISIMINWNQDNKIKNIFPPYARKEEITK